MHQISALRHTVYLTISFWLLFIVFSNKLIVAQSDEQQFRFGVIESYESPADATTLGVSWTRVRFQWAEVQADGADTWTPAVNDEQIDGEISNGRQVVGLLIGIPEWARDENKLPTGLWLSHDDPANSWANFVREAVERYNGRINHWIIWNEPDIADPTALGHTWDGSIEDFIQLQRIAYLVAKDSNPIRCHSSTRLHPLLGPHLFWSLFSHINGRSRCRPA